jgi:cytochrome c oxidase subunit 2
MGAAVGVITLIASLCAIATAIFVGSRAREAVPGGNAIVYRVRTYYAAALAFVLLLGLTLTLGRTPYGAYAGVPAAVQVDVEGRMWSWDIRSANAQEGKPLTLPSGEVIDFAVTAADVNHGFGIYDESGHLIAQTQAMPGYVNHLRVVFDAPGRYRIFCLEYCGLVHHMMFAELIVQ